MLKKTKGFTLLELLIAMMVFSILSIMAYAGLRSIIDAKMHTEKVAQQMVELQTAFMFIGRDIEQAIGRSVRDGFGDVQPAMQGGGFGRDLIHLTRAGYTNFLKTSRSNLQRVAYRLADEELTRVSWPMLDQDFNDDVYARVLLDNVKKVEIFYVDRAGEKQDQWPPAFGGEEDDKQTQLPNAVIITIEIGNTGEIRRVFRVLPGENIIKNGVPQP
ncbi:MAG: type II secretion system minor pseudopilin GspJ [Thiomicrorhabdus sp.]|nr:type II secretion system minor pseudopilin GspJ [Thiomicrorhabdus sp.]